MRPDFFHRFRDDEDGAVTVDWVVLTAGVIAFGILTAGYIARGATDTSSSVGAVLNNAQVPEIEFEPS